MCLIEVLFLPFSGDLVVMCVIEVLYLPVFLLLVENLMLLFSDLCLMIRFFSVKTERLSGFVKLMVMGQVSSMMYYLIFSSVDAAVTLVLMGLVWLSF